MWFFLACTSESPPDSADTGADTGGTPNAASYCAEVSSTVVTDPSTPAEGFDFAAAPVLEENAGDWLGTFEYSTTGTDFGQLSLAAGGGEIVAVTQELVNPGGNDTGLQPGAPDPECPNFYRIPVAAYLRVGDSALSESATVDLEVITPRSPTLLLTIAVESLLGDARPTWDTRDWAYNTLYASAYRAEDQWHVSVGFWGSTEPSSRHASPKGEADSGGTVEPSGVSESYGNMVLDLDEG
ncbi:MAG: hypothetical protein FJ102_21890 [Deltaproteobacteria bacterium]|nr:hypothetical protein [Deltaproteobacteria bacterium]